MEVQQVVVLTENGSLQLTSLSRHVLFHAVFSLLPKHATHALLPKSGSRKIENFTSELPQAIVVKGSRKKSSITDSILGNIQFVPSLEIHKFLDRATSVADFVLLLERQLLDLSRGEIDPDRLHDICWRYYEIERKPEISIPQWFSTTCTYRLWLIFCCVQEQELNEHLSAKTANEVIKRLVELCGYTWNESYRYSETEQLDFPQYLRAIASYFTKLQLEMSLTCEVILDMLDEIVHGVLKKGYLTKKGHKRKNLKKRWFVLQRNIMKYFDTRDAMSLKGQLILNSNTEVKGIPDKGKRRFMFEVTCGQSGKEFEIFADDQRSKHEWMLAIKKAIALAKVMDGSLKHDDYTENLTGFYLLKYGTPKPSLSRQDSTVRGMKYHATMKAQRSRLSGKERKTSKGVPTDKARADSRGEEYDPFSPCSDEYMEMKAGEQVSSSESSEESDDGYTAMSPFDDSKGRLSRSMELLVDDEEERKVGGQDYLSKSCTISHASLHKPQSLSLSKEPINEEDSSEDEYDEASFPVRYKPPTHDPQLGGYVEVQIPERKSLSTENIKGKSTSQTLSPTSDEDREVGLLTARSVNLERLGEMERAPSPNKYLTIIRDSAEPNSSHGNPPQVPKHRKSPSADQILNSSQMEHTSTSNHHAPAVKPKPKVDRVTSLVLDNEVAPPPPSRTIHRGSEPVLPSPTTSNHSNNKPAHAPPLPPR